MPIFEYKCTACGTTIEVFEKISSKLDAIQCKTCLKNGKDELAFKKVSKINFKVNGYNAANGYTRKT